MSSRTLTPAQKRADRAVAAGLVATAALSVGIFCAGVLVFSLVFRGSIAVAEDFELFELEESSYTATVDVSGVITPEMTDVSTPDVSGTVEEVLVEDGDEVSSGDTLLVIDSPSTDALVSQASKEYDNAKAAESTARAEAQAARAALSDAKAERRAAQAAVNAANAQARAEARAAARAAAEEAEAAVAEEEGEDDSSVSVPSVNADEYAYDTLTLDSAYDTAVESAQAAYDEAAAALASAESASSSAYSSLASAQSLASSLNVRASIDGVVSNLDVTKGMNVSDLSERQYVMQIADPTSLSVLCSVGEDEIDDVMRSQEAEVTGIFDSGSSVAAEVSSVATKSNGEVDDEGNKCFDVALELETLAGAEMDDEVEVSIAVQDYGSVFVVPDTAVATEEGVTCVVIVYDDGSTSQREVEVVAEDGDDLVVRSTALAGSLKIRSDFDV